MSPESGPDSSSAPPVQSNWLDRAKQFCRHMASLVSPKLRWAILAVAMLAIGLHYFYSPSRSAKLKITGRHAFRNLAVSVSIDGKPAFTDHVAGATRKRLKLLSRFEGSFSRTVSLEAGNHIIEVRGVSAGDHFDQQKQCAVTLIPGGEASLLVSAGRSGMSLQFQGGRPNTSPPNPVADYAGYLRSILLTMAGSALSAAIGFIVQDFLKSKKAGVPALQQSSQNS